MKVVRDGPTLFCVARRMTRYSMRGGGFMMRTLRRLGLLDVVAEYKVGRAELGVPLSRLQWDFADVANYEFALISCFSKAADQLQNAVLFDCGADIGTFSSLICAQTDSVTRVVAFEPNTEVLEYLRSNLERLGVPAELVGKAVSSFNGRGRLERAEYDPTDHARFLVPGDGPIDVTTIDAMSVARGDVAIKVDVEGGELQVLQGAAETIRGAHRCVVTVEANPDVARRTGRDPIECLQFLQSLRPFRFTIAETGQQTSTDGPLWKDESRPLWNIVCCSYE